MVIKSKIKIPVFIKVILLIAVGAAVCGGLYYLLDTVWNGLLVDWFSKNFIHTYDMWLPEAGKYVIVKELDWYKVKLLLLAVLLLSVTGWLLSVFFISRFWAKQREKKTVGEICVGIKRVLNKEAEETDVFPENYADIAVQIIQMKHTMQHHEQVLREETKQKNDLITYLAHDLKTPLTSVIGYLSLLDEAADMPEPQRMKYVGVTLNKALRLEQLINEFFDIIRYNLQQMVLEKETIDLYYMLAQLTDEFYPILQEHGNQACLQAEEDLTVYGDAQKLARVFQNLLKNAIAYSYVGTEIRIAAQKTADGVTISFSNRGKTIPQQKLTMIFEKYFRLDEARTSNSGGAGLGLAIAKEIVNAHGGSIWARSEQEETVFFVTLP